MSLSARTIYDSHPLSPTSTAITGATAGLDLSIHSAVPEICLNDATSCSSGAGDSLISLSARGNTSPLRAWPAVTIVFVLETSPYDGAYDPTIHDPGNDTCALLDNGTSPPCYESNAVPFFAVDAGIVAKNITAAHPGTRFTFGLVDYSAAYDRWDDGDGYEYHVDIGRPVPASEFGPAVNSTFVNETLQGKTYLPGSGLSDNILESPSITALYGVLAGAGISWTNSTHHVIVWMGSTAPRDPNYPENYCVTPSAHVPDNATCPNPNPPKYMAPTCEPSYAYGTTGIVSPNCEGWIVSHNGVFGDSIANFAHTSTNCAGALGGNCTIDTVDVLNGIDDFVSGYWAYTTRNDTIAFHDALNILGAGCDMENATGGTWAGFGGYACPDGTLGTLYQGRFGTYDHPITNNSLLMTALANVGLGTPPNPVAAFGNSKPMFTFATTGNIAIDPDFTPYASCSSLIGSTSLCQRYPNVTHVGMQTVLQWNWSTDPNLNTLYTGDNWTAYLQVMATGPPVNTPVPIDACTTIECFDYGSVIVDGYYTSAAYFLPVVNHSITPSFPLALITVVGQPPNSLSSNPPPPPPTGGVSPPVPAPSPVTSPVVQPVPVFASATSIGGLSVQATAAGMLAAGFAKVAIRPRTVAMKVGVKSGAVLSAFDKKAQSASERVSRFE